MFELNKYFEKQWLLFFINTSGICLGVSDAAEKVSPEDVLKTIFGRMFLVP